MLYINGSCRVVHTGTVHTHAHTHRPGFTVQVKGLIRDERRPHIAPCKGPLSPFLLQWSVKLWETNDLRATALCATAKEKGGGGGKRFCGRASVLAVPSSNNIPTMPSLCTARRCFLCLQLLLQPSQQQNWNCQWREKDTLPHQDKVFPTWLPGWLLELNG